MSNPYDPYQQNQWNNPGMHGYQPQMPQRQPVPNATLVLIFGIVSIAFSFCYGIIGLGMGIAALVISKKSKRLYEENPAAYDPASWSNLNAGRICATIGVIIGSLVLLLVIIYIIFVVTMLSNVFSALG